MMRIWTYVTLDADMEPVAAGTYFDPALADLNAVAANNTLVQPTRTGMPLVINDPTPQYPVAGTLTVSATHVDLEAGVPYDGGPCYFGPVIYEHNESHLPFVIFNYNINASSQKCYVARIVRMDEVLEAHATDDIHNMMHLSRVNMPRTFQFGLVIMLDGIYTSLGDVTSGTWNERFAPVVS